MPTAQIPIQPARGFHVLDEFQRQYLKFNGREPRTLEEVAIARAEYLHRKRLAEIKALREKMALLDALLPALAARGIQIGHRDITTWDRKTLRFTTAFTPDNKFFDALIAVGFKEVERKDSFRDEQRVTLKHGRALLVSIDVKKAPVAAEAPGGTR